MHRIAHEPDVAQKLLEQCWLSVGFGEAVEYYESLVAAEEWNDFNTVCTTIYDKRIRAKTICASWWESEIKRKQLRRFLMLAIGDIVVVPLSNGNFSIFEVDGEPKPVSVLKPELYVINKSTNKTKLCLPNQLLVNEINNKEIDLGFVVKTKPVKEKNTMLRKEYADARLTTIMKFPRTNTDIVDEDGIKSVDRAIKATKPINFYNSAIGESSSPLLGRIDEDITPDKLERLIKWYMERQGFIAVIAAKNETGKPEGSDVDVIAMSEALHQTIYIQAKKHTGETDEYAVEQVVKYCKYHKEQKDSLECDNDDNKYGHVYAQWVITTAKDFSLNAKSLAENENVRLINGIEFARMLIDSGINNINNAFE
jgi:hypothetical protein